jgi:hypothetical protein
MKIPIIAMAVAGPAGTSHAQWHKAVKVSKCFLDPTEVGDQETILHAGIPERIRAEFPQIFPSWDPTVSLAADLLLRTQRQLPPFAAELMTNAFLAMGCSKGLLRHLTQRTASHKSTGNLLEGKEIFPGIPYGSVQGDLLGLLACQSARVFPEVTVNYPAACATGLVCLIQSIGYLDLGHPLVLAGAAELTAVPLALAGFRNMGALSPSRCRPFDRDRNGFNTGDGGALFALLHPNLESRLKKSDVLGWICGWDICSAATHPTACDDSGETLAASIRRTLTKAHWGPDFVQAINAHGTGTILNDRAEARAILKVFGPNCPPVFSLKGAFGHLLGASSAFELAVSLIAATQGVIPGTVGLQEPDPDIAPLPVTPDPLHRGGIGRVLKIAMGFGGPMATMAVEINPQWTANNSC